MRERRSQVDPGLSIGHAARRRVRATPQQGEPHEDPHRTAVRPVRRRLRRQFRSHRERRAHNLPPGQDNLGYRAGPGRIVSYGFDHATQQYHGHYVEFTDGPGQYRTIPFRYVWPSELDLMAQLAGLRLRDRWADWNREPFTAESRSHVSVWQKPGQAPPPG